MEIHETTYPSVQIFSRRGILRLRLVGSLLSAMLLLELCGWLRVSLHEDYRADQWRALVGTLGITDPQSLRESLREGHISREDFPAALFHSIETDHPPSVENLLAVGVNLRVRDEQGRTPQQLAKHLGRTEIARMLRRAGAQE